MQLLGHVADRAHDHTCLVVSCQRGGQFQNQPRVLFRLV